MTAADAIVAKHVGDFHSGKPQPEMLRRLCLWQAWLNAQQCRIRDSHGDIIPLRPNRAQKQLIALLLEMAAAERPVRIVVAKARKTGISTCVTSLAYFLCAHVPNQRAVLLAHEETSTRRIFDIARGMNAGYRLVGGEPQAAAMLFPDTDSRYDAYTAGGLGFGAGQTPNIVHLSEVALWPVGSRRENFAAIADSLPAVPETIMVVESTARGRDDLFWPLYEQAGDPESAYERLFVSWFLCDKACSPVEDIGPLDDDETLLRVRAKDAGIELTDGHLAWRRSKVLEIGPHLFRCEYPSTPEEAIQGTDDLILPGLDTCIVDTLPFDMERVEQSCCVGGIDFGYHDATCILSGVYYDQTLYVASGYSASHALSEDHVQGLVDGHTYFCDPSAVNARQELARAAANEGVHVHLVPAPRKQGERQTSFVNAEWAKVATLIRQGRLRILRACAEPLLREAASFAYNPATGQPDARRTEEGHHDCLDALRYMVLGACRNADIRPLNIDSRYDPSRPGVRRPLRGSQELAMSGPVDPFVDFRPFRRNTREQ